MVVVVAVVGRHFASFACLPVASHVRQHRRSLCVCVCASGCRLVCSLAVCFVCFNRVYYMPLCHWQGWAAGTGRGQITLKLLPQKLQRFLFINFNCFNKQQEPAAAAETGTNKVVKCFLAFFFISTQRRLRQEGKGKCSKNISLYPDIFEWVQSVCNTDRMTDRQFGSLEFPFPHSNELQILSFFSTNFCGNISHNYIIW